MLKKIALGGFFIVLIILIAIWFGGRWILSFSTADYEGSITVSGTAKDVEITFDQKGIPQIWAENKEDMYFALGWVHASERLFQMELIRRLASGRLSEIFGEIAFESDLFQRRIGFSRKAEKEIKDVRPEDIFLLQKYCAGINEWIKYKSILPPEFVLLGFSPEEWKPADCLSILIYQTWYSHSLMDREENFNFLSDKLGDVVWDLVGESYDWSPATIPPSNSLEPVAGLQMSLASNSWVISPGKSASGHALHASDPHLTINSIPCFWYIAGLHSKEGTNIIGVTTPGLPFVAMGHTDSIAYAFTVASVDVIDYFRIELNPSDNTQIRTPEGFSNIDIIEELIKIKEEDTPRSVQILKTAKGVVIESDSVSVKVLKWAGFDFNSANILRASLSLPEVATFEHFRKVVTGFGALDVNWTYSDIKGNIGYQLGAPVPIKEVTNSYKIFEGNNYTNEWSGYHPTEETPFVLNPAKGWIATCNNQIVSDDWDYKIPGFYDPYRITRLNKLLAERPLYTAKDMEEMQLDLVSGFSSRWKQLMAQGAQLSEEKKLAEEIIGWNGSMELNNKIPAIFMFWWQEMIKMTFEDDLEDEWRSGRVILEEVLSNNVTEIIDDKRTESVIESAVDISAAAFQKAKTFLGERSYSDISKLEVAHPLSRVKLLDYWLNLNRGPFPIGGDKGTLNANFNFFDRASGVFRCSVGPSMRFVLDWNDVDSFTINSNLGQSGNPFSPHYDNFLHDMQEGNRWTVPMSKSKVYESKMSLLKLKTDQQ